MVRRARGAKKNKSKLVVRFSSAENAENRPQGGPVNNEIEEPEHSLRTGSKSPEPSLHHQTNGYNEDTDEEGRTVLAKQQAKGMNNHNGSSDESNSAPSDDEAAKKTVKLSESDSDSD